MYLHVKGGFLELTRRVPLSMRASSSWPPMLALSGMLEFSLSVTLVLVASPGVGEKGSEAVERELTFKKLENKKDKLTTAGVHTCKGCMCCVRLIDFMFWRTRAVAVDE